MAQPVICQNCHTEMEPGEKTRSRVMGWTEYACPNCGSMWSEGNPLPGHEPVMPKAYADAESFADDLLARLADDEEVPEDAVDDGDLMADEEESNENGDDA